MAKIVYAITVQAVLAQQPGKEWHEDDLHAELEATLRDWAEKKVDGTLEHLDIGIN